MNQLNYLILPAFLGLMAGISHGLVSHHAELPYGLTEQLLQPLIMTQIFSK